MSRTTRLPHSPYLSLNVGVGGGGGCVCVCEDGTNSDLPRETRRTGTRFLGTRVSTLLIVLQHAPVGSWEGQTRCFGPSVTDPGPDEHRHPRTGRSLGERTGPPATPVSPSRGCPSSGEGGRLHRRPPSSRRGGGTSFAVDSGVRFSRSFQCSHGPFRSLGPRRSWFSPFRSCDRAALLDDFVDFRHLLR